MQLTVLQGASQFGSSHSIDLMTKKPGLIVMQGPDLC